MFNSKLFAVFMVVCFVLASAVPLLAAEDGELVIAIGTDPESLDPVAASSSPAAMVMVHIMEPLFEMTVDGEIVPLLAEGYDVCDDGLVWTVHLKEGIEFHDGAPFNAEAVKFNLERLLDEEAPYSFLIDAITEIEVVDEYAVRLYTEEQFAPIINHLSHDFISMISPQAVEKYGEDVGENPVGTGAFVFEEWRRGEEVRISRNDQYWGENARLDEVVFKIVPEDGTRVVMLETGEADAIMRVPPREVDRLEEDEDVVIETVSSLRTIYIGFNNQIEPFNDRRVRQAFNYGVDKEALVDHILHGAGRISDAPIAPAIFGYSAQEPYEYDPDRARELLAEAGYPDGLSIELHHPVGRYLMDETLAESIQVQLAAIGVEVELTTMEWVTYLEFLQQPPEDAEHEMYMLGWGCVTGDADYGLYPMFHSSQFPPAGWELSYMDNPEVDELLDRARVTPDEEERLSVYFEAIELIWEEAPWLFLHSELQINGVRSDIRDLIHHPREQILAHEAWRE